MLSHFEALVVSALSDVEQHLSDITFGDEPTAPRLDGRLELSAIVAKPDRRLSELSMLTEAERHDQLVARNDTSSNTLTTGAFTSCSKRKSTALLTQPRWCREQRWTYREVNRWANRLAHHLRRRGVGAGTLVGLAVERSAELVVGALGILKAGGAYVPLDIDLPRMRLDAMVLDAGIGVVVTRRRFLDRLPTTAAEAICLDDAAGASEGDDTADPPSPWVPTAGLRDVHVRVHRPAEGRGGAAPVDRPPRVRPRLRDLRAGSRLRAAGAGVLRRVDVRDLGRVAARRDADSGSGRRARSAGAGGSAGPPRRHHALADGVAVQSDRRRPSAGAGRRQRDPHRRRGAVGPARPPGAAGAGPARAADQRLRAHRGHDVHHLLSHPGGAARRGSSRSRSAGPSPTRRSTCSTPAASPSRSACQASSTSAARGWPRAIWAARPDRGTVRADPFSGQPGARLYRTGDQCRWRADGELEFLGRLDDQVKLRGFRIELGEIEVALGEHPNIARSVVVLREDAPGEQRLVAYCLPTTGDTLELSGLSRHLRNRLPDYMVPAAFVALETLPLTPGGKVDRHALPAPDGSRPADATNSVAPRTPIEQQLVSLWSEVLAVDDIGIHDNFFELGGDSILAIQVLSRLRQAGLQLSLQELFERQTIAELAPLATKPRDEVALSARLQARESPLLPSQHWFFEHQAENPRAFSESYLLRCSKPLDPQILQAALSALEQQHDALRLRFNRHGASVLASFAAAVPAPKLEVIELSGMTSEESDRARATHLAKGHEAIDHVSGPVWNATYFHAQPGPSHLLLTAHHLVMDRRSWCILVEDLETAYTRLERHEALNLPPEATTVATWGQRLRELAEAELFSAERDYWAEMASLDWPDLVERGSRGIGWSNRCRGRETHGGGNVCSRSTGFAALQRRRQRNSSDRRSKYSRGLGRRPRAGNLPAGRRSRTPL